MGSGVSTTSVGLGESSHAEGNLRRDKESQGNKMNSVVRRDLHESKQDLFLKLRRLVDLKFAVAESRVNK